jgi:hypothetical protein
MVAPREASVGQSYIPIYNRSLAAKKPDLVAGRAKVRDVTPFHLAQVRGSLLAAANLCRPGCVLTS